MFKVEKNAPMAGPRRKYPFPDLKVGESFFVPSSEARSMISIRAQASATGVRLGFKFSCRKTADGGLRVWRIK
jgi:hypothetical protein